MSNNHGQKLAGKIAVITGGNSGIGLATAKRFVEEGAHVVITGRREKELKEAAALIGRNVTTVVGDVTRLEDLDRLYAVVKEKHGHIDVLFANAGWGEVAPLVAATEAHFDKTFDLNAKGTFFTTQKALPLFKDGGSIILTSSVANVRGDAAFTAYAAAKAAVRCFARGWTMELKDRKVRVNSMSPGPIETPALENAGLTAEQVKQAAAQFASEVPLGRRGKPEEVAAAVLFLASDESSYISIQWFARHPHGRVERLSQWIGISDRQLRRRFSAAVGYGPKMFQSVLRFQRLLNFAGRKGAQQTMADLALNAGYTDQAHMTREVRRFANCPPTVLLRSAECTLRLSDLFKTGDPFPNYL